MNFFTRKKRNKEIKRDKQTKYIHIPSKLRTQFFTSVAIGKVKIKGTYFINVDCGTRIIVYEPVCVPKNTLYVKIEDTQIEGLLPLHVIDIHPYICDIYIPLLDWLCEHDFGALELFVKNVFENQTTDVDIIDQLVFALMKRKNIYKAISKLSEIECRRKSQTNQLNALFRGVIPCVLLINKFLKRHDNIYLRFVCPSIVQPKNFRITKKTITSDTTKRLVAIAKIILNIAVHRNHKCHQLIDKYDEIMDFLNSVVANTSNTSNDQHKQDIVFTNLMVNIHHCFLKFERNDENEKLDNILYNLGEPIFKDKMIVNIDKKNEKEEMLILYEKIQQRADLLYQHINKK